MNHPLQYIRAGALALVAVAAVAIGAAAPAAQARPRSTAPVSPAAMLAAPVRPAATLAAPVSTIAATPDGRGYWMASQDGGVYALGDAPFYGSEAGQHLAGPIVGMAGTPDGKGYWLVGSDGGVFAFGDAGFYGSEGGKPLSQPVVGMAATPDGKGYWLVAADGGVFAFGDAGFYGSTGSQALAQPVVGIASSADGRGYWLTAADGGVFAFGDAPFEGSEAGHPLSRPVVGIARDPAGPTGYWLGAADGGVFAFGGAPFEGSLAATISPAPVSTTPPPIPGGGTLSAIRQQIVNTAIGQQGYNPATDGCSRYNPDVCSGGVADGEWCSVFATWVWEQAGVPIPIQPYSGDPFYWAQQHTYVLSASQTPAPGDLVFFGSPSKSAHVAIVTQVLPSGAIVTMNGNDGNNEVGASTFVPPSESELPNEYGYASPVMDQTPSLDPAAAPLARPVAAITPRQLRRLIRRQDPKAWLKAQRRQHRRQPAFAHMPYAGKRITIEITNYTRRGRAYLLVLYHGSRRSARREFRAFLRRYHDRGRTYRVSYRKAPTT